MVDLASPSWGRILTVGLLLCAAVAINCSGGGDVEVENPCFFSTGGPDNSGSQKICAVAGEQTVEDQLRHARGLPNVKDAKGFDYRRGTRHRNGNGAATCQPRAFSRRHRHIRVA